METSHRHLIFFIIGGFCLSILSLAIWIFVNEGRDGFVVGQVTEMDMSSFVVEDRYEEQTTVLLTASTTVRRGRDTVSPTVIVPGVFVQVNGAIVDGETIAAESVQLMRPPKDKDKPYDDR